ncbi:hypothetical protein ACRC6Q_09310 [Planococcus sp. SE5232]|uniref:hypothetical protein n=1 Tax=unclassified Planococcus (in: firmicutes) TaxID=2662419 RepID=UPI003D6C4325
MRFLWPKTESVAGRARLSEGIQGDTERHKAAINEMTLEERLQRMIQHQQQTIDRMAQSIQKQEEQNGQILEEVKTLKGSVQPLDAPSVRATKDNECRIALTASKKRTWDDNAPKRHAKFMSQDLKRIKGTDLEELNIT